MGRNAKKSKGSKANVAGEQGLKEAATLATSSTNVTTPPSRPARTAKHKVRRTQPQPMTSSLSQGSDATKDRGSQSLKEPQPSAIASLPSKDIKPKADKQDIPSSDTPATRTTESPSSSRAAINELPLSEDSLNEREAAPISTNLSDSYNSSSSSSETEMGLPNDAGPILNKDNLAEKLKNEQGRMGPAQAIYKGLVEMSDISLVTEEEELPERAGSIGHISQVAAIPTVARSFTCLSTRLQEELEVEVSRLKTQNAYKDEVDQDSASSEVKGIQASVEAVKIYHQEQHIQVESPGSRFETKRLKQMILENKSLGPAIAERKENFELLNAEPDTSKKSTSSSETTLIGGSATLCELTTNLKQKINQEDQGLNDKKNQLPTQESNEPAHFTGEVKKATNDTASYQIQSSVAENNAQHELWAGNNAQTSARTETREAALYHIEEAPPYSILESAVVTDANQMKEQHAFELNTLQHQHEQSISNMAPQQKFDEALQATETEDPSPRAEEQPLHAQLEQNNEHEMLNIAETGTVKDKTIILNKEYQFLAENEESTTRIFDEMFESTTRISEADKGMQERLATQAETLSSSGNVTEQAQQKSEETASTCQTLECQEKIETGKFGNTAEVAQRTVEAEDDSNQREFINESPLPGHDGELANKLETDRVALSESDKVADLKPQHADHQEQQHTSALFEEKTSEKDRVVLEVMDTAVEKNEREEDFGKAMVNVNKTPDVGHVTDVTEGHATIQRESRTYQAEFESDKIALVDEIDVEKDAKEGNGKAQEQQESQERDHVSAQSQAAQNVAPEEIPSSEKHNSMNSKQHLKEEGNPEAEANGFNTSNEHKERPDHIYSGSVDEEHPATSVENQEKSVEVGEVEMENREEKECPDEIPNQLYGGTVIERHPTNSVKSDKEKLEVIEQEVEGTVLIKEELKEEKLDQAHVGFVNEGHENANSLEFETETPDEGKLQVEIVNKAQESQKETPGESCSGSLHKEHTRSVESEMAKIDIRGSEVSTAIHNQHKCHEENPIQLDDTTNCMEKQLQVEEPEVESATLHEERGSLQEATPDQVDGSYTSKEDDTSSMGNQLKEPEMKEPNRPAQLDEGAVCEEQTTNTAETQMKLGEPDISLHEEEGPQEIPEHHQATSVGSEHQTSNPLENAMKLDVGNPLVGGIMLHEDSICQEDKQLGKNNVCLGHVTNSAESNLEKLEKIEPEVEDIVLENKECPAKTPEQSHVGSVCDEVEGVTEESQKEKPDGSHSESQNKEYTRLAEKVDGVQVEESVVTTPVHDEKKCQEEKHSQLNDTTNSLELEEPEVESVQLEEIGCQKETPAQVNRGYICKKDDPSFMEYQLQKSEMQEPKVDSVEEKESQEPDQLDAGTTSEGHATNSVETEKEHCQLEETETTLNKEKSPQENPGHDHATSICDEHQTSNSLENATEKLDEEDELVEGIALQKISKQQEGEQHCNDTINVRHAENSATSATEKLQMLEPEVEGIMLDKEECQNQKLDHDHIGSADEEQKTTNTLESVEKPYVGEPLIKGATLDKPREFDEENRDESRSESVCEDHTRSLEHDVENLQVGESEVAIAVLNKKECIEEKLTQLNDYTNCVEKKAEVEEPEVASATMEEEIGCQKGTLDHIDRGSICKEDDASSMGNLQEKVDKDELRVDNVAEKESQEDKPPQIEGATLDKTQGYEEGKPEDSHSESVCECTRSVEHEVQNVQVGESEVAIAVPNEKECIEKKPAQLDDSTNHVEKKEEVEEPEVENVIVEEEIWCPDDTLNQTDRGSSSKEDAAISMGNPQEKPDLDEGQEEQPPEIEGTTLDKTQESKEEKPDNSTSESVCEECKGSVVHEVENVQVGEPEVAIAVTNAKDCIKEKPIQLDEHTSCVEPKAEVEEPEVESATMEEEIGCQEDTLARIERGYICKQNDARSVGNQLEKFDMYEPKVDSVAEKESQEDKPGQRDAGVLCKTHPANSLESEMDLHVGEQAIALIEEECLPEKPDHNHANSCQEHQTADSLENAMENLDVEEPFVGGVTLQKDSECQENEQLDQGTVCEGHPTNCVAREIEKLDMVEPKGIMLDKNGCWRKQLDQAHIGYVYEEHTRTPSSKYETQKPGDRKPKIEDVRVVNSPESQEKKPNESCSESLCEHHTRSTENEMGKVEVGESDVAIAIHDGNKHQEEKSNQINDITTCVEKQPEVEKPEVESATLQDEGGRRGTLDQGDKSYTGKEDETHSMGSQLEQPEVKEPKVDNVREKESPEDEPGQVDEGAVCERQATNPVETEMEHLQVEETDTALDKEVCLQETDHVPAISVYQDHQTTDNLENAVEKLDVANSFKGGIMLQKDFELQENKQLSKGTICEGPAQDSVESDLEQLDMVKPEVQGIMLEKEECGNEKFGQVHVGSVCEEHKTTKSLENEMEKPDEEENNIEDVTLDKADESQEEIPEHKRSNNFENEMGKPDEEPQIGGAIVGKAKESQESSAESVGEEPRQSVEHEMKRVVEMGESETVTTVQDEKQCKEEKSSQPNDTTHRVEKTPEVEEPEAESAKLQEETPEQVERCYICKEDDISPMENELEKPEVKKPKADSVAEEETQEDKFDQLNAGAVCEGHPTNPVESKTWNLEVGEPALALDKEESLQAKPDHDHAISVCQEHETAGSLENVREKLDVVDLNQEECLQEKLYCDRGESVNNEHHTHNSGTCHGKDTTQEYAMEKLDMGEPLLQSVTIDQDQECQETKAGQQLDRGTECEEHATNSQAYEDGKPDEVGSESVCVDQTESSEETGIEQLEVGELDIPTVFKENGKCQEEDILNSLQNGMEKPEVGEESKEESAIFDNKQKIRAKMPHHIDSGCVCNEHEMPSMEKEVERPEVEELGVESVMLHMSKESHGYELDQLDQLESEVIEVENPEVDSTALEKAECREGENQDPDGGFAYEQHQNTHVLEHAIEKNEMGEQHVGITLDQVQELLQEKTDQVDTDSVNPTSSMESELEKLEVEESETAITSQVKEYQEEKPCQLNVCDKHSTYPLQNAMDRPEMKETDVEGAALKEKKECQLEASDHVESDLMSRIDEAKSVNVSVLGDPELHVALDQEKEHQEHDVDPVNGFRNNQVILNSAEENLENFDVGEPQECLALKDKEACQGKKFREADLAPVYGEHTSISVATELQEAAVGEQEAKFVLDCRKDPGEIRRDSVGEEHTMNVSENKLHTSKEAKPEEGSIKLDEEIPSQPANVENGCQHRTSFFESERKNLQLEEPEAEGATLAYMDCYQKPISEEHTTSTLKDESVTATDRSVNLEEEKNCEEEKPDDIKDDSQSKEHTSCTLESEIKMAEDPDVLLDEKPRHLDSGSECQVPDVTAQEKLESGTLANNSVHQECILERVDSSCVSQEHADEVREPEADAATLQKTKERHEDQPDQIDVGKQHPMTFEEHEMKKHDVGEAEEEYYQKEECQKDSSDQLSSSGSVSEAQATNTAESEIENLESQEPVVATVPIDHEKSQEQKPDGTDSASVWEPYATRTAENVEKLEVEDSEVQSTKDKVCQNDNPDHASLYVEQTTYSVENEVKQPEVGVPQVDGIMIHEQECHSGTPEQVKSSSEWEKHALNSGQNQTNKLELSQTELEAMEREESKKEREQERTCEVNNGIKNRLSEENPEIENVHVKENKECQGGEPNLIGNSASVSKVQTEDSVESDTVQEVEVLNSQCQGEQPYQLENDLVCKEHETHTKEDDHIKLEVKQPEIGGIELKEKDNCRGFETDDIDNSLLHETDIGKQKQEVTKLEEGVALEQNEKSQDNMDDQIDCSGRSVNEVHIPSTLTNIEQLQDLSLNEKQVQGSEQKTQRSSVGDMNLEKAIENDMGKLVMNLPKIDGLALEEKEETLEENHGQVHTRTLQGEHTMYSMQKEVDSTEKCGHSDADLHFDTVEVDLTCEGITPMNKEVASDEIESQHQPEVTHSSFDVNEQSDDLAILEEHLNYSANPEKQNLEEQKTYTESECTQNQNTPAEVKGGNQNAAEQKLCTGEKATDQDTKSPKPEHEQRFQMFDTVMIPLEGNNNKKENQNFENSMNSVNESTILSEPPEELQTKNNNEKTWKQEQPMDLVDILDTESQCFESTKQQDGVHCVQVVQVPIAHHQEGSESVKLEQVIDKGCKLACTEFPESQEATVSTANEETKEEKKDAWPLDALNTFSPKNKANESGLLHTAQDVAWTSTHDFTADGKREKVDRIIVPAEVKHEKTFEEAPENNTQISCKELTASVLSSVPQESKQASENDPKSRERQDLEVRDVAPTTKRETEELETRNELDSEGEAPRHQEHADEVASAQKVAENKEVTGMPLSREMAQFLEQLNTAKPEEAEQKLGHQLESWEQNQQVNPVTGPALHQTQESECGEVNDAMPMKNMSANQVQHIQDLKADDQKVHAEAIRADRCEQAGAEAVSDLINIYY